MTPMRRLALVFVFAWFFLGGIAHFVATELEMMIVPVWLPAHRTLVLASGALELLGAAALLFRRTRRWAGWGLIALTVAVTPANIHMLLHAQAFPAIPYWALVLRLPLQLALIVCIWWATQPRAPE
nr:hypothetical protein [Salinisphaera japonica]